MKAVATIKLKIPMSKVLLETMKQYSQSMQTVVDCGWDEGIYFKRDLHDLTYYSIRENSNLPAQLVCYLSRLLLELSNQHLNFPDKQWHGIPCEV